MRTSVKIKRLIDAIGASLFLVGIAGLSGAIDGEGSLLVSAIVFGIGLILSIWGYQFE